jgi:DNA-binding response OmpR family regulator
VTDIPVPMLRRLGCRLLIIDDEEHITSALTDYFTILGYAVDFARDKNTARALLERFDYAGIITDLRLSGSGRIAGQDVI